VAAVTARKVWARMARMVQWSYDVQRRTWCSSGSVRPLPDWTDYSTVQQPEHERADPSPRVRSTRHAITGSDARAIIESRWQRTETSNFHFVYLRIFGHMRADAAELTEFEIQKIPLSSPRRTRIAFDRSLTGM
jgi:hypothetical protein